MLSDPRFWVGVIVGIGLYFLFLYWQSRRQGKAAA